MVVGHGNIKREYKSLKPKKSMCRGCRDDFYNGGNPYGTKECWHFKDAKVVDSEFYPNLNCTAKQTVVIKKTLSCYIG